MSFPVLIAHLFPALSHLIPAWMTNVGNVIPFPQGQPSSLPETTDNLVDEAAGQVPCSALQS